MNKKVFDDRKTLSEKIVSGVSKLADNVKTTMRASWTQCNFAPER